MSPVAIPIFKVSFGFPPHPVLTEYSKTIRVDVCRLYGRDFLGNNGPLFACRQQHGLRLGNNNLARAAALLAADASFTKSGATARRTLLGLGNWQSEYF